MYETPRAGRRIGPAVIAFLVVLAAAAGTVGYFGARKILAGGDGVTNGPTTPGQTTPSVVTTTQDQPDPPTTTKAPKPTALVPAGDKTTCPQATTDAVVNAGYAGDLAVVFYGEYRRSGNYNAEVWICINADGKLIYQGHVLSAPLDSASNGVNTLLIADGINGTIVNNGTEFVATNPNPDGVRTTEYHVSANKLVLVELPNNTKTEYQKVRIFDNR